MGCDDEQQARELARLLATPAGLRTARLLQLAGTLTPPEPEPENAPAPATPGAPRPISIWQPRDDEGELAFVRPAPLPLGDHYAAREVIPARKAAGCRRVCFFGESVAAGYLYAPHLTPARVLETLLQAVTGGSGGGGGGSWEVVDLARTNETLAPLAATVDAARQLDPDVLVVFAGNNWGLLETPDLSPYAPAVAARQRFARALAGEGAVGPARLARRAVAERADQALAAIAAAGVPTVVVVPEVNLADWETLQPPVWLPGDGNARWHALFERALGLLAAGDWRPAEAAAWEMVELDGGTCPTPFRLLCRALEGQDRLAAARDAAISEVDSVHYPLLAFLAAPQAGSAAREILTRAAARHGLDAVDLRPVFAEHAGSPLPGRRLFLDYCHLTAEGMKVAMAAVAERVLARAGIAAGWQELARLPGPALAPEAEAVARLGAAVHTAHRLLAATPLAADLLGHWCAQALAASPAVAEAMLDLAAARTAPGPAVLTAAQQRNLASPYRLTLQHGWRWDGLDAGLLSAMAAASPTGAEIERLLLARRGLGESGEDLARPPFHAEPLLRFYPELLAPRDLAGRAALRCPWPAISFWLVADGRRDVCLELTARLPRVAGRTLGRRETVAVELGGAAVGAVEVAESWSRGKLRVPRERLQPGANRLTLRWPPPPPLGGEALAFARRRLEDGIEADLHPVFGEVWSLFARGCRPGCRRGA